MLTSSRVSWGDEQFFQQGALGNFPGEGMFPSAISK
jgi:hypothetical protein